MNRHHYQRLALTILLGAGLIGANAHAQAIIEVGEASTIGSTALTTVGGVAKVPAAGVKWTANGGVGVKYSSLISPAVAVGADGPVTLKFTHRYNFETGWDGGAVYVRVNGGAATYVPAESFSANGYVSDLSGPNHVPPDTDVSSVFTGGLKVFTGQSTDWGMPTLIESVATLGEFTAGQTISVEFRGGWDESSFPGAPNWEIGTVEITDWAPSAILNADFTVDGTAGFTVTSDTGLAGPWTYLKPIHRFEIDAVEKTADRYQPDVAGSVINLNGANIRVVLLPGTLSGLQVNDSFTLFDLIDGTTLTGSVGTLTLPPGTWDTSNLATTGTIVCTASPIFQMYEPFVDPNSPLEGNTPGAGLSGTWASNGVPVLQGGLFWGSLPFTGDRHIDIDGRYAYASTGSNLADFGLLADGKELWFSTIIRTGTDINTNPDIGMALGSHFLSVGNNLPMANTNGGLGLGFTIKNNQIRASYWSPADPDTTVVRSTTNSSNTLATQTNYLVVGKFVWGETSDTLSIYLPDTALNLGAVRSSMTVNVNQSLFNILSLAAKGDGDRHYFDEIRFGATSAEVMPADPAPLTLAIVDNKSGGPILESTTVVYTLTFNKNLSAGSIDASDFENGGTAPININSVVVANNLVTVTVTPAFPGATGTLKLQVKKDAVISDFAGTQSLDTSSPVADETEITVNADTVLPTVVSITSPAAATPIYGLPAIPYIVTFDKYFMDDLTVTDADFSNAGTATISVGTVSRISTGTTPAVYSFSVTPTSTGTLQLRLSGTVSDVMGNSVAVPVDDDAIYTFASLEPARKTITLDGSITSVLTTNPHTLTFNASGSDKLVVILTGEHGNPGGVGDCTAVTYDGVALTKAVDRNAVPGTGANPATSSTDQIWNDIWYLDKPATSTGLISATVGTRGVITAIKLSGTAPGFGGTAVSGPASKSVTLLATASGSMVIASHGMGGDGNTANVGSVSTTTPLTKISGISQSSYDGHVTGRMLVTSPAFVTPTFTGGNVNGTHTIAVEFIAAELTGYGSWAGGFAGLTDTSASLDFDKGGLATGIEWVVGGDPTLGGDDAGKTPTLNNSDPTYFKFVFKRRDAAAADPKTAIRVQYGTDLATWRNTTDHGVADGVIVDDSTDLGGGFHQVTVSIPKALAVGGKLFAWLDVIVTP